MAKRANGTVRLYACEACIRRRAALQAGAGGRIMRGVAVISGLRPIISPAIYTAGAVIVVVVGAIAWLIPAMRATKLDPSVGLRADQARATAVQSQCKHRRRASRVGIEPATRVRPLKLCSVPAERRPPASGLSLGSIRGSGERSTPAIIVKSGGAPKPATGPTRDIFSDAGEPSPALPGC